MEVGHWKWTSGDVEINFESWSRNWELSAQPYGFFLCFLYSVFCNLCKSLSHFSLSKPLTEVSVLLISPRTESSTGFDLWWTSWVKTYCILESLAWSNDVIFIHFLSLIWMSTYKQLRWAEVWDIRRWSRWTGMQSAKLSRALCHVYSRFDHVTIIWFWLVKSTLDAL